MTISAHPTGRRWQIIQDPERLAAQFQAMSRREKSKVDDLARVVYRIAQGNARTGAWFEAAQEHPSFEEIQDVIWNHLAPRWRGSAICQLMVDALCGPADDMPVAGWGELDLAIGLIRETNP